MAFCKKCLTAYQRKLLLKTTVPGKMHIFYFHPFSKCELLMVADTFLKGIMFLIFLSTQRMILSTSKKLRHQVTLYEPKSNKFLMNRNQMSVFLDTPHTQNWYLLTKSPFFLTAAIRLTGILTEKKMHHFMPYHGVLENLGRTTLKSLEWANHLEPSEIQLLAELTLSQVQVWHVIVWFRAQDWMRANQCRQHSRIERTNSDIHIEKKKIMRRKEGMAGCLYYSLVMNNLNLLLTCC